jgi:chromatin remodeling complex protein RSC6
MYSRVLEISPAHQAYMKTPAYAKHRAEFEFASRPRQLSPKLQEFLGVSTVLTRAEVMGRMKHYVEVNELRDGHVIRLDDSLKNLLGDVHHLNYLNIQKHLNHHYVDG